jgi:hypothetical protein
MKGVNNMLLDYEFVDENIDYQITKDQVFIEVDPGKGIWAEIHKEDVIFLAKRLGVCITKEQKQLFDLVVDSNKRLQEEITRLKRSE